MRTSLSSEATGCTMTDKKVSRREFLTRTSLAASAASVATVSEPLPAAQPQDYVQSEYSLRAKALVSVLTQKNLLDPAAMDQVIDHFETKVGPHYGAKLVARSWVDPEYRQRLLADANSAAGELGIKGLAGSDLVGTDLIALANSAQVHNLVVCTLCSCYPWSVLGLPPAWYKDTGYRARAVIDPRGVLKEFGVELDENVEVRVWDSTADIRYLVIPDRPSGTEGMTEEQLRTLITRDSMVGAQKLTAPTGAV